MSAVLCAVETTASCKVIASVTAIRGGKAAVRYEAKEDYNNLCYPLVENSILARTNTDFIQTYCTASYAMTKTGAKKYLKVTPTRIGTEWTP